MLLVIAATLALRPLDLAPGPALSCDGGDCARVERTQIAGRKLELWHGDDGGDGSDTLAIAAGDGQWWYGGIGWESYAANMTEYPYEAHRAHERVSRGTLADGSPAVVLDVVLLGEDVDRRRGRVMEAWHEQRVLVCTLRDTPTCGEQIDFRCPKRGCGRARLARGVLRIGRDRYDVTEPIAIDQPAEAPVAEAGTGTRRERTTIGGTAVELWHEGDDVVAIEGAAGWSRAHLRFDGARVHDRLIPGTLADGAAAAVLVLTTDDDRTHVLVCSLGESPSCSAPVVGTGGVSLDSGWLTVGTKMYVLRS